MSLDYARHFIDRVRSDDAFSARLSNARTVETRLQIAEEEGYEFTIEEFDNALLYFGGELMNPRLARLIHPEQD
jgi:predicted ribosomally synthesized peptide with nif11-like leader